jgi:filamentous hemagglutinin
VLFHPKQSKRLRRTLVGAASRRVAGQQIPNANTADKLGGISLSVSLGSSKSQSASQVQNNSARGSSAQAGGDITIVATGAAANTALTNDTSKDLTIQGSNIVAGKTATLAADNNIHLLAAQNTTSQTSHNSSISAGKANISSDGRELTKTQIKSR